MDELDALLAELDDDGSFGADDVDLDEVGEGIDFGFDIADRAVGLIERIIGAGAAADDDRVQEIEDLLDRYNTTDDESEAADLEEALASVLDRLEEAEAEAKGRGEWWKTPPAVVAFTVGGLGLLAGFVNAVVKAARGRRARRFRQLPPPNYGGW